MMNLNERRFLRYELSRPCLLTWPAQQTAFDGRPFERGLAGTSGDWRRCLRRQLPLRRRFLQALDRVLMAQMRLLAVLAADSPVVLPQAAWAVRQGQQALKRAARLGARLPGWQSMVTVARQDFDGLRAAWQLARAQQGLTLLQGEPAAEDVSVADPVARLWWRRRRWMVTFWQRLQAHFAPRHDPAQWPVQMLDLGAGGVGTWLVQDAPVRAGTPVNVFIALTPSVIFAARGQVRFCRQDLQARPHRWRIGVDFEPLDPAHQQVLTWHVQAQEVADALAQFPDVPGLPARWLAQPALRAG